MLTLIIFSVMAGCSAPTHFHIPQKSLFGARFVRYFNDGFYSWLPLIEFKFLVGTLGLALGLYIFLSCRRSRKREAIYHVEANQINGPSLGTTFDPRTATLSATYPRTPEITISPAPPGRGTPPRSPHFATARQESLAREIVNGWPKPPQTAPVNKVNPYPFPGYSPVSYTSAVTTEVSYGMLIMPKAPAQQPHTAFQSGFPRALYTGQAVQKERNKEWVWNSREAGTCEGGTCNHTLMSISSSGLNFTLALRHRSFPNLGDKD